MSHQGSIRITESFFDKGYFHFDSRKHVMISPLVVVITPDHNGADYMPLSSRKQQDLERPQCFLCLLEAGADVNVTCERHYPIADEIVNMPTRSYPILSIERATTPLFTASYYSQNDMIQALLDRGADVNFQLVTSSGRLTSLTTAIQSEGFEVNVKSSSLQVIETLQLLISAGANVGDCELHHQRPMKQLIDMTSRDREQMAALQKLVKQPCGGCLRDRAQQSFRERQLALAELIRNGADPKLCCERDQLAIQELLSWPDEELYRRDEERRQKIGESA